MNDQLIIPKIQQTDSETLNKGENYMKTAWKFQDAEKKFGLLVKNALTQGPQYVNRDGFESVVIISVREYHHLISEKPGFTEFLLGCPKTDINFDTERQKDFSGSMEL
ncbi:MAG: type II toxin-antitoxin system prevent-host-death family antitoxin [Desulfococcaceae bacterium]